MTSTMNATFSEGISPPPAAANTKVRTASCPAGHPAPDASGKAKKVGWPAFDRDTSGETTQDAAAVLTDSAALRQKSPAVGEETLTMLWERCATSTGATFNETSPGTTKAYADADGLTCFLGLGWWRGDAFAASANTSDVAAKRANKQHTLRLIRFTSR